MRAEKIRDRPARSKRIWRPVLLLAVLLSGACAGIPEAPPPDYVPAPRSVLGGLALSAEDSGRRLLERLTPRPNACRFPSNASQGLAGVESVRGILRDAGAPDEIRAKIAEAFDPWTAGATGGEALVTGYYEPVVEGSCPFGAVPIPPYAVPDDLVTVPLLPFGMANGSRGRLVGRLAGRTVVPYSTRRGDRRREHPRRERIGTGLAGRSRGTVLPPRARVGRRPPSGWIGAAHRLRGIERAPVSKHRPAPGRRREDPAQDVTMQAIRDYLARNLDERDPIFHHNESYVFFRWTEGGPFGSRGEARSVRERCRRSALLSAGLDSPARNGNPGSGRGDARLQRPCRGDGHGRRDQGTGARGPLLRDGEGGGRGRRPPQEPRKNLPSPAEGQGPPRVARGRVRRGFRVTKPRFAWLAEFETGKRGDA